MLTVRLPGRAGRDIIIKGSLSPDETEHLATLAEAFLLVCEREDEREGTWKRAGVRGNTYYAFGKIDRAMSELAAGRVPNRDHFLDAINYAAFAVRLGKDMDGTWPW